MAGGIIKLSNLNFFSATLKNFFVFTSQRKWSFNYLTFFLIFFHVSIWKSTEKGRKEVWKSGCVVDMHRFLIAKKVFLLFLLFGSMEKLVVFLMLQSFFCIVWWVAVLYIIIIYTIIIIFLTTKINFEIDQNYRWFFSINIE